MSAEASRMKDRPIQNLLSSSQAEEVLINQLPGVKSDKSKLYKTFIRRTLQPIIKFIFIKNIYYYLPPIREATLDFLRNIIGGEKRVRKFYF